MLERKTQAIIAGFLPRQITIKRIVFQFPFHSHFILIHNRIASPELRAFRRLVDQLRRNDGKFWDADFASDSLPGSLVIPTAHHFKDFPLQGLHRTRPLMSPGRILAHNSSAVPEVVMVMQEVMARLCYGPLIRGTGCRGVRPAISGRVAVQWRLVTTRSHIAPKCRCPCVESGRTP